ncbi:MAG: O-antigen ligase family protein [Bacilli bacterium]|nr:O-antigen ligase family protein [Bacilli bacterium]
MVKIKNKAKEVIDAISKFMDTMYFALALVGIELLCYYLELDLITILVVAISATFALLFKKDLNCLFFIFLCMSSMISFGNSPGNITSQPTYYFQPGVYITCIIAAAIPISIATYKGIKNIVKGNFKNTPLLISIFALCIVFFINGIFSELYKPLDALFGVFMVFFFGIFFIAIAPQMKINKESIISLSRQVAIYAFVPIVELCFYYLMTIINGESLDTRTFIFLGWGNRNTLGFLFLLCLCFIIALIKLDDNKAIIIAGYVVGTLSLLGVVFSFSRQAYVCAATLVVISLIYILFHVDGKKKTICIISLGVIFVGIIGGTIVLIAKGFFETLTMDSMISFGDGRISLWTRAIEMFETNPIFGGGFYYLGGDPKVQLNNIMPLCCHNTILQLLSACGLVGLIAYGIYRFMTVKAVIKNFDSYKVYPILGLLVILITSLLDIHLFDLFGSSFYAILLAMAISPKSEISKQEDNVILKDKEIENKEVCL